MMRGEPVGTNGVGEPRYRVADVPPGSIIRYGIDDDMVVLVVANFAVTNGPQNGDKPRRRMVYYGCFCEAPDSWEQAKLFHQDHELKETLTVLLAPEYS